MYGAVLPSVLVQQRRFASLPYSQLLQKSECKGGVLPSVLV